MKIKIFLNRLRARFVARRAGVPFAVLEAINVSPAAIETHTLTSDAEQFAVLDAQLADARAAIAELSDGQKQQLAQYSALL